jgi:hypothetical protein
MASAFDWEETRIPQQPGRGPASRGRRGSFGWTAACVVAVVAVVWWAAPRRAASPPFSQRGSRSMHIAEVLPTDRAFGEPQRAFGPDSAYWRVKVLDAQANPVAAARVSVDLVGPDGAVCAHLMATTGDDGAALFSYGLGAQATGVYTVRVVNVSHLDPEIPDDRTGDEASANSFSVTARTRR